MRILGIATACAVVWGAMSQAAVISTNGSLSSANVAASIIAAPADVNDDATYNLAIQAFDELQTVTLLDNLAVDGGFIAAGTVVDSHMVFLNSGPGNSTALIEHGFGNSPAATFTFDGNILGVMSSFNGSLEIMSTSILGALGTTYPDSTFDARGLEGDPLVGFNDDYYSFLGNTLTVGMRVTEPGDWIRVVTATPVPLPAGAPLLLAGLGAFAFARRRAKA